MSTAATERLVLRRSLRGIWSHLPVLLLGGLCVCVAASIAALLAPGVTPVSVVVLAVLVTPPAIALCACANDVVGRDDTTWRRWVGAWRPAVRTGLPVAAPIAVTGGLFLVALEVWRRSGQQVLLVSVGVSGAVTLALVPLTAAAVQLVTALPTLFGAARWKTAAVLTVRWPVRFVAAPVLLAFGVWIATRASVAFLLLVPVPVAMINAAALWTCLVEMRLAGCGAVIDNDVLERKSV